MMCGPGDDGMTLIEDARRLKQANPFVCRPESSEWRQEDICFACYGDGFHTHDCPTLAIPHIVAALEAAERMLTDGSAVAYISAGPGDFYECNFCYEMGDLREDVEHKPACSWQALVSALKGEEVTA
jgi:hypothetical protein